MKLERYNIPSEQRELLEKCKSLTVFSTVDEIIDTVCGEKDETYYEVTYDIPNVGKVVEAEVSKVRNGISVNYPEVYMRRRDPDCMMIGDDSKTDKTRFAEKYGEDFSKVRSEALDWLKGQELAVYGFTSGADEIGYETLVVAPANAAFFALGLAMLQGIQPYSDEIEKFSPKAIIYVVPPFRHTHFDGKQVVVHNRTKDLHEIFSFNLYPGPSAKKGVYGILIERGEREKWVTTHSSVVKVTTPYDNTISILHEGASGGGKSEMLETIHREKDGTVKLAENTVTNDKVFLEIPKSCTLNPIADDMAMCVSKIQNNSGKLRVIDAENGWFIRVNHIDHYNKDIHLEKLTAQPPRPLLFFNIDAVPKSRALIWEHKMDSPGKPCPNPRVIIPRDIVPGIKNGPVSIDIRSFGVRAPLCTKENPSYGIIGLLHFLPPALAWLWRLVSPRGDSNPSIVDSEGISSEGVGSYWPFAVGQKVKQANLLLEQFVTHDKMRYILTPNQHIGAWKVDFAPQWIAREYLARRGNAGFKKEQLSESKTPILGYNMRKLRVEGYSVPKQLLQVELQPEVGQEAYDFGVEQLYNFFLECLNEFDFPELDPLGRKIIECCRDKGSVNDYNSLVPGCPIFETDED
ncbi:DUF4914 family protein [Lentisphaerota bacterium ZTH]|nr:DUF4914 family protein [Lentisphaerota bacterium]WET05321.1 DUF4914 family protein [Lentisphaerota bacterium ZTH]